MENREHKQKKNTAAPAADEKYAELARAAISDALGDALISAGDIPDIDLYIDQIIGLVNSRITGSSEHFRERLLTKTMVNNYSKDGLIKPIKGKKYSKEHIVQMLLIYSLKNTLSISEIKSLFDSLYLDESFGGDEMISCYERFVDVKQKSREKSREITNEIQSGESLDLRKDTDRLLLVLTLVSLSAYLRESAEALVASDFITKKEVTPDEKQKDETSKKAAKLLEKEAKQAQKALEKEAKQAQKLQKAEDQGGDGREKGEA